MRGLRTVLVAIVALLGYPFLGLLLLIEANRSDLAGWTWSAGPTPLIVLMFLVPVVLTAITAVLGGVRLATSALLTVGTLAASSLLLFVLVVMASNSGALS